MINATDFISNSDLATFKNDTNSNVFSVTIPNGFIFNPSSPVLATQTLTVGSINAGLRGIATSSKYPLISAGTSLITEINVLIAGSPTTATLYSTLRRISPSELRLQVEVESVTGAPNHTTTESQTITFTVSTFLSPFD